MTSWCRWRRRCPRACCTVCDSKLDASDRELDTAKRAALIKEVNDYVMDSAALLPVFYKTTPYAYASGLTGNFDLNFYYIYNFGWNA